MPNQSELDELFRRENDISHRADELIASGDVIAQEDYHDLLGYYKKVLKQLKRTTKFNDINEKQLRNAHDKMAGVASSVSKYLPQQIYQSIFEGKQLAEVAATRKPLTVFFSDIANFTETTEHMGSEDLVKCLNYYLSGMFDICEKHGGTIDKTIGDALLIFFGDPHSSGVEEDALKCVRMAIEMREALGKMQRELADMGITRPFKARMGISSGYCTVGSFGGKQRMDYTIIGEIVNQASRIETNSTPDQILVSHQTFALVKKEIYCKKKGSILVKGVSHPLMTYEVVDSFKNIRKNQDAAESVMAGFSVYFDRELMNEEQKGDILKKLDEIKQQVENTLFLDQLDLEL